MYIHHGRRDSVQATAAGRVRRKDIVLVYYNNIILPKMQPLV